MTTNTARQPQGIPTGGQFAATTHAEPGIVLSGGRAEFVNDSHLFQRELEALAGAGVRVEEKDPATKAETRRLLKNARGEANGAIRRVNLDYTVAPDTAPGEKVEIVGPKDGRPIIVDITSGIPSLKVTSGTAIIRPRSSWGNSIDVGPGAEAILIAPADAKVTTECEEGGKVTFVSPSPTNRFRVHGQGDIFLSTGTDTDRVPYDRTTF